MSSLLLNNFFFIFQEGTLVVGGPGSFYWQGNTSPLYFLFNHSILLQSLSEWDWQTQVSHIPDSQSHRSPRISAPSNKLTRLTLPPPSEQNNRHSDDDTSLPMSPVSKIIRDYLSVLVLPLLSLFGQSKLSIISSVKCSVTVHSSQMGQWWR